MNTRLLLSVVSALGAAAGCSNAGGAPPAADGGDAGDPAPDAPGSELIPATVRFARDVYPIVAGSCVSAGCHDTGTTMNHWNDYSTAESTHTRWVSGPGFDFCVDTPTNGLFTERTIVVPGDPDGSYLVKKIAPETDAPCQDPTHHRRMPPEPREPLSPNSIATIVVWIREGARDD